MIPIPTPERVFDHVVIIMFENEYRNYVRQNSYMRSLAASGIDLATYFGVMHPSNTNYVASIAGETCGIIQDPIYNSLIPGGPPASPPVPLPQLTIADRLHQKGLGWRAYMDAYNTIAFPPRLDLVMDGTSVDPVASANETVLDYPPYINAHNPFVAFQSIFGDREQWERIGTLYDFFRDCLNDTLPEYSWISPGLWGDGHWLWGSYDEPPNRAPVLVDQGAKWLRNFFSVLNFPGPRSRVPRKTLIVVTYDEADFNQDYQTVNSLGSDYDGPNQLYTVLLGDTVRPGRIDSEGFNHYSLLKTIEKNFGLDSLGKNDAEANWFRFLWNERFQWRRTVDTPIGSAKFIAAAGLRGTLWVVSGDGNEVSSRTIADRWSDPAPVPAPAGTDAAAMAAIGDTLVLVCRTSSGLSMLQSKPDGTWSAAQSIVGTPVGSFALTAFTDYGDRGRQNLMLVYAQPDGAMQSQTFVNGAWNAATAVGQTTAGALTLASLGTSLFLIYAAGSNELDVVSYNTAGFNANGGAGVNNTTQYLWSPSAYPVAYFSFAPDAADADAPDPVLNPYRAVAPFAAATLDGVIHLAHPAVSSPQVVTETFSLSGLLTPQVAVNDAASSTTGSNGWGTLAEAGWTLQVPVAGVRNAPGAAMAMAHVGSAVVLLTQASAGGAVAMTIGSYERSA